MRVVILLIWCVIYTSHAEEWDAQKLKNFQNDYWAFQPHKFSIPKDHSSWVKTNIDKFISQKLNEQKLIPSQLASKEALIKRAYYALTGLPPTFEQVQSFVNDPSPKAYEKLIDRLLASKEYGEKWARHWLDLARFADTLGFLPANKNTKYPFSYTYRDYVIRSFNEDKPYNEFIMQQLAADRMKLEDKRDLAALGFLTAGERFLNKRHEIINDQIDVTTQAFLGLTVSCARCHDHKFDPIPTADYYSMFGIFSSIEEPKLNELPIIGETEDRELYKKYQDKLNDLQAKKRGIEDGFREKIKKEWPPVAHDYIGYIFNQSLGKKDLKKIDSMGNQFRNRLIGEFKRKMLDNRKNPAYRLIIKAANPKADLQKLIKDELTSKNSNKKWNEVLKASTPKNRPELLKLYQKFIVDARNNKDSFPQIYDAIYGKGINSIVETGEIRRLISNAEDGKYNKVIKEIAEHHLKPGAPPRAMVVRDKATPTNPYVFLRGKPSGKGPKVPRRYLQVLSIDKEHENFKKGSGRLELAKAIADERNPLTARVIVNRVWQWHFGTGIVNTPSNFGVLGSKPTNPQLLDYLADYFIKNGWSFKKLHKHIMTSAVYMQSSVSRPQMAEIDGPNTYLWKMNNRRLAWEELRDSIVIKTGGLQDFAGPGVEMLKDTYQPYRTIYGFVDRNNVPAAYKSFDFPSALVTCEMRANTIVPQQGLFLLNSNFVMKSAKMISENLKAQGDEARIKEIFKKVYSRAPSQEEIQFSQEYLEEAKLSFNEKAVPEWIFGYATLTDDKMLKDFVQFKFFNKSRWQVSKHFPDKKIGYAMLSDKGGHPGKTKAVVRRCKIHKSGTLSIKGAVKHKNDKGNGVRVLILHNGTLMGEWDCKTQTVSTACESIEVQAGDVIDMVVDAKANPTSDSFEWPLEMQLESNSKVEQFSTVDSFFDKRTVKEFTPWDGLVQVLIMSSEFLYVD